MTCNGKNKHRNEHTPTVSYPFSKSELNTKRTKDEDTGKVVVVKELRASVSGGQPGDVVTAATPDALIEHLRENHKSVDPDYTEVREGAGTDIQI